MDNDALEEMFEAVAPISIRRMFGGKGIYRHGIIFALDLNDEVMLKADQETAPLFKAAGARQWSYEGKHGKPVLMPYWSIPEEALDDADLMARWVRLAYEAGERIAVAKPARAKR